MRLDDKTDYFTDLWALVRESDQKAFYLIYDGLWEELLRKAYLISRDGDLSKDIVQDVLVSLWERRQVLEIRALKPYLFMAVRFRALETLKTMPLKNVHLETIESTFSVNPADTLEEQELAEKIDSAVNSLPERCRQIFEMSRFNNLTNQEIAEELSISKRTVETQISKALKFLRVEI